MSGGSGGDPLARIVEGELGNMVEDRIGVARSSAMSSSSSSSSSRSDSDEIVWDRADEEVLDEMEWLEAGRCSTSCGCGC